MKNKVNLTLLFFAFAIQLSFTQTNLQYVSKVCAGSPVNAIVDGNYLYVIDVGLVIFNFTDASNPSFIKHLTPMEGMYTNNELIINGDTGYATWDGGGIMLINFSSPENPTPTGNPLNNSYDYQNLVLKFPYLYAIAKSHSTDSLYLQSINVTNGKILDSVNLLSGFPHIDSVEAKRFIIDGNYLYLAMGPRGVIDTTELHIFNISAPSIISHIITGTVSLGKSSAIPAILQNSHWDLVKKNNYVYVAAWFVQPKSRIKIVDVTDPYSPHVVKEWMDPAITGGSGDIEISGNNLLLTDWSSSFNVISITNDTTLSLCKRISNGLGPAIGYNTNFFMQLSGNYAFLFNLDNYAVYTVDVSSPCNAVLIDTIPFAHDWKDIAAGANSVFTTVWNFYQLYSLDVSDEMNPIISHRTEVKGSGWGIDVKNNFAYLAMGMKNPNYLPPTKSGGLIVYDISKPDQPLEKGWSPPDTPNIDVQVFVNPQSNLAYVISGQPNSEGESHENHISKNPGLRIVNVSNPDSLIQLGIINITPQCRGIFQEGNYAYIAASSPDSITVIDTSGLYIVDVSIPAKPSVAGKWICTNSQHLQHNGHTRAVYVKNGYAYLAHSGNLLILDVSDPKLPLLVNEISLGNSQTMDVAVSGNFVFALTQQSLFVFDISSNPENPAPVDSVTGFFATFRHFDIKPPYIYVLSSAGVFIFKFDGLAGIEEGKNNDNETDFIVYPNPFSETTTLEIKNRKNQNYELKIYDLYGREVRKYKIRNQNTEISRGDLPSGMYFYQVNDKQQIIGSGKLIIQ